MFRTIFRIDGCVMIVVGLLLWGWPHRFEPPPGIPTGRMALYITRDYAAQLVKLLDASTGVMILQANERTVFLGMLLIALGVASLAFVYSMRTDLHRKAALYFIAGHLFLGFTVWTMMTGWATFAGFLVFDLVIWPVPVLLYGLLPYRSAEAWRYRVASPTKREIHEAAGQEERNRLAQDLHDSVKQQIFSVQPTSPLPRHAGIATLPARGPQSSMRERPRATRRRK
jgi:signal transduction histidine kinase